MAKDDKAADPAPITPTAVEPRTPERTDSKLVAPPADADRPAISASPHTMEDPSRELLNPAPAIFAGYPKDKFHPVRGKVTVADPNEEAGLPGPRHNWFDSASEADAHRTEAEAQQVLHNNRRVKVDARVSAAANDGKHDLTDDEVLGNAGVVRNSVAATESLKAGNAEPL